jgi:hypothetical protein
VNSTAFAGLEPVGASEPGDALDPNPQTLGGQTDLVFTRRFRVNGANAADYLFQILNPASAVVDSDITDAYLVNQRLQRINQVDQHLVCVFAQIPSRWSSDVSYQNVTFPGVDRSELYAPGEFEFRSSPTSISTQVRYDHEYFLGPIQGIATFPRFKPVDSQGLRVSTITDYTTPSADTYISMVNGRQEIVVESVVLPWKGNIFDRRTLYALAK